MSDYYELTADEQVSRMRVLAEAACPSWDFGAEPELTLLKFRENGVFRVDAGTERYVMRVHRAGYHSPAALASELRWMDDLRANGVGTPATRQTRDGQLFATVSVEQVPEPRLVDVLSFVDGEPLGSVEEGISSGEETIEAFHAAGQMMASLHNHAETWVRPADFERHSWDVDGLLGDNPLWGRFWELAALDDEPRAVILEAREQARRDLEAFGAGPDRYGLIHADFLPENLLVADGSIQLIDFDDAGFGWHLFDIATSLFMVADTADFEAILDAFVSGYRTVRDLPDTHLEQLPLFMLLRGLTYLGWLHTRQETETAQQMTPVIVPAVTELAAGYLAAARVGPA